MSVTSIQMLMGYIRRIPISCPRARRLKKITYDEMLEMARAGAKVLHPRSVEMAKKYGVPLYVKSSFPMREAH